MTSRQATGSCTEHRLIRRSRRVLERRHPCRDPHSCIRGPRAPETGSVLVLLILLMIPLMGLASAMISMGARQVTEREASRGRAMALLNAESGIDHGLAQLLGAPGDFEPVQQTYDESESLRYLVQLIDLGEDDVDNDGDGLIDEEDEGNLRRLESRGSLNVVGYDVGGNPIAAGPKSYTKRIRAFGKAFDGLPQFPWAVYLGDPNAEIQFNGNSFLIDGSDHSVGGSELPGADAEVGIATTGDPKDIVDQLSAQQKDNVDGDGGEPSVGAVPVVDLHAIIDDYKSAASIKFSGSTKYNGHLGDPDGNYVTVHSDGDLEIAGGSVGAGLLLVEGNLDIVGSFEFTGIIIVTGRVIFRGGGGGKRVVGTLLVGGDVIDNTKNWSNPEDLEVSGTVDILYSSEAQTKVGEAVSTLTIFGWQEL